MNNTKKPMISRLRIAIAGYEKESRGGWAAVISDHDKSFVLEGKQEGTTSPAMTLTAIIRALESLPQPSIVDILTNFDYVSKGWNNWMPEWQRFDGEKSDGSQVKNWDLWQRLCELAEKHDFRIDLAETTPAPRDLQRAKRLAAVQAAP